jgi:hypothetical protein
MTGDPFGAHCKAVCRNVRSIWKRRYVCAYSTKMLLVTFVRIGRNLAEPAWGHTIPSPEPTFSRAETLLELDDAWNYYLNSKAIRASVSSATNLMPHGKIRLRYTYAGAREPHAIEC